MADASSTGVKNDCIFNNLLSFHVTQNKAGDITHNIFLGFARCDNCLLIKYILSNPDETYCNIITLNMINSRIGNFNYGVDSCDKPPAITESHLKSIAYARNCKNKTNLPLSIAIKHQLALTYHFVNNTFAVDVDSYLKKKISVQSLPEFSFLERAIPRSFLGDSTYKLKSYRWKGFLYKIDELIVINVTDILAIVF